MIRDNGISYYCNLASPAVLDREALKYIDYDLDVKVFPSGEKKLLDVDEYQLHGAQWHYSTEIDRILKHNVLTLVDWIEHKKGPFSQEYVDIWYSRYLELSRQEQ
jgi:protein associated with RNAse G/E